MRKLAIIPARYASSRFPGKPLIELKGKSMIQHVFDRVKNGNLFDKVVVATDDQRIYDHVKGFGGNVEMTKTQHETGTDRCGELVANKYVDYDIVVNIQGDEPLVSTQQLNTLINAFQEDQVKIATLGIHTSEAAEINDPNRIKIVLDKFQNALYFSRSPIPFLRNESSDFKYIRHIGLYAFRTKTLLELVELNQGTLEKLESLEQLRWMENGYKINVQFTSIETPNIDVPEDVEKVLRLM